MVDRPILFSAPMVRALLAGTKTQTRRVLQGSALSAHEPQWEAVESDDGVWRLQADTGEVRGQIVPDIRFEAGDRLYVREAWRTWNTADRQAPCDILPHTYSIYYEATPNTDHIRGPLAFDAGKFRQAMHMPRWASRLTLTVTEVRVQRLQDISESDAVAEGCFKDKASGRVFENKAAMHVGGEHWCNAREWYADLWDHLNADRGFEWDTDPWVVAISFTVERRNIDAAA
ncbi:MAG TPA: hypothetical protein VGV39_04800 [Mesorhizobium sp.]|jgi:hypothetical protein|uniref:hypothetical protein n=1 Tax=Mesorhizobium sp. TaxID=1871066 RepID=UPI002DDC905F|nr:hypothetical protein [Mesorhizobium sp.]HEV2502368.1 hypothetical protein [Mesorhizobium sp.]